MNQNQLMGRAIIRANGQELAMLDGTTFTPAGVLRTAVKGYSILGFQEAVQEAKLEGKIQQTQTGLTVDDVNDMDDVTLTFEADIGQTWVIVNAWSDGGATLTDKGEIDAKFTGKTSERTA